MVRVSAAIMAHPRRQRFVPGLLADLNADVPVIWDRDNNRWDTGRRAMLAYDPTATHHVVIQDDAIVPADLLAGLEQALRYVPKDLPVGLYIGKITPQRNIVQRHVMRAGEHTRWIIMNKLYWGVGVVMPTSVIEEMVKWCDHLKAANYDVRISSWCRHREKPVYYPWPSLVDHRNSPSLVAGRTSAGRHAHRFIGVSRSVLDVDWDGSVLDTFRGGSYRVVGACAIASVVSATGHQRQIFFRRQILPPDVPKHDIVHLLSVGLIEPIPESPAKV